MHNLNRKGCPSFVICCFTSDPSQIASRGIFFLPFAICRFNNIYCIEKSIYLTLSQRNTLKCVSPTVCKHFGTFFGFVPCKSYPRENFFALLPSPVLFYVAEGTDPNDQLFRRFDHLMCLNFSQAQRTEGVSVGNIPSCGQRIYSCNCGSTFHYIVLWRQKHRAGVCELARTRASCVTFDLQLRENYNCRLVPK